MKKLLLAIIFILALSATAYAENGEMYGEPFTIAAVDFTGDVAYSPAYRLNVMRASGFFSAHLTAFTGTGSLKIQYQVSNVLPINGAQIAETDWIIPTTSTDIVAAHTATSGKGGDGKEFYQFPDAGDAIYGKLFRFKFTKSGTITSFTLAPNL